MVELGWERVPYSTGWEGAVANLGGNMSRKTWVGRCVGDVFPPKFAVAPSYPTCGGRVPTQVCWHTFPPNFWKSKPRHGGGAGPQGSWIISEKSTNQQPTFVQKVDLILAPSPIHKDENDRKWIL